ncbi:zinc finger protein 25-like [Procambarus clarkii]|uniref:zinc finger protein 25-like n=1 Tax=Procambarus clarkii TaxID=6728 RepID=UPI001E675CAF|nr:zinc finger protein 595-like [Procambarus clarkii]
MNNSVCLWDVMHFEHEEANNESSEVEENGDLLKRSKRNTKRLYKCMKCSKVFPSKSHLKEHEISHSDRQPYRCIVCDKGFKRKNALSKHMRVFHPDGPDTVRCSCGRVYASQELMEKHQACSGSHRLLVCPECGALYKTDASLKSHMILHKESEGNGLNSSWPFTCHACGKKFSSQASLNNHTANSHSTYNFQCQQCDKICKTKKLLSQHCLRKHKIGSIEFPCPVCNKVFCISKDLGRHMQSHNPEGIHECSVCHSKFKTYSTLQSHVKIHSKGKPYDCVLCLLPCDTIENLKEHIFSHHNIEIAGNDFSQHWNRKCLICGQIFLRRSGLVLHMKSHFNYDNTELVFVENCSDNTISVNTDMKNELCQAPHKVFTGLTQFKNHNISEEDSSLMAAQVKEKEIENAKSKNKVQARQRKQKMWEERATSHSSALMEYFANGDKNIMKNLVETKNVSVVGDVCVPEHGTITREQTANADPTNDSLAVEYETSSVNTIPDIVKASTSNEEETKYICGECAFVFTDVNDLKTHLLTCYQQDTNDEYVVVFEVDKP